MGFPPSFLTGGRKMREVSFLYFLLTWQNECDSHPSVSPRFNKDNTLTAWWDVTGGPPGVRGHRVRSGHGFALGSLWLTSASSLNWSREAEPLTLQPAFALHILFPDSNGQVLMDRGLRVLVSGPQFLLCRLQMRRWSPMGWAMCWATSQYQQNL